MMLDIRVPIGYLFLIFGALLTVYGLVQPQLTRLELAGGSARQLVINLNLPCGISMLLFAGLMLGLAFFEKGRQQKPSLRDEAPDKQEAPAPEGQDPEDM